MEISASPNTNALYYTSAPTSPRRYNLNGFFFLSMPTSPTRQLSTNRSRFESGPRTPETTEYFPSLVDGFEFEGSKRFSVYDDIFEKSHDLSIAYADELFYDGKMLPLRPPPKAQRNRPNKKPGNCSTASSPGARSSMLRVPFFRQRTLWNDEFDPFMTALNKVKEEGDMVSFKENKAHLRRAKSLSPLRWPNGSTRWNNYNYKTDAWLEVNGPQKNGLGPTNRDPFRPILKPREEIISSGSSESRKQRIKKFLFKNASFGKEAKNGEKREQKTPLLLSKLHNSGRFSSTKEGKAANFNSITRISREMKTLMKQRTKLFFCLAKGFGSKGKRKMS